MKQSFYGDRGAKHDGVALDEWPEMVKVTNEKQKRQLSSKERGSVREDKKQRKTRMPIK